MSTDIIRAAVTQASGYPVNQVPELRRRTLLAHPIRGRHRVLAGRPCHLRPPAWPASRFTRKTSAKIKIE